MFFSASKQKYMQAALADLPKSGVTTHISTNATDEELLRGESLAGFF